MALERGWKVARRSQLDVPASEADVLLLDTLGELTHAYGAARAAFVGGTITGTGHNVLEPIAHGIPVFFGPKRGTFGAEQEMCEAAGVGFRVQTPDELTRGWEQAITDEEWRSEIKRKAQELNKQGASVWDATVKGILELVE
jgi:3-deoxy-D-manno-octulosonic-acid transferase